MAFATIGFDGTVNESSWAMLHVAAGIVNYKHGVTDAGYVVTPSASALTVSVSPGTAIAAGVYASSNATITRSLDPGGSSARIDYMVLEFDWMTNTVDVVVVKGSSLTWPTLTQVPGIKWQMPLARVRVPANHNAPFTSALIGKCAPQPRDLKIHAANSFTQQNVDTGAAPELVATIEHDDPGWPYRMRVVGAQSFSGITAGQTGILIARYGDTSASMGTEWARGHTGANTALAHLDRTRQLVRTGSVAVGLYIASQGGDNIINNHTALANNFEVHLIPA